MTAHQMQVPADKYASYLERSLTEERHKNDMLSVALEQAMFELAALKGELEVLKIPKAKSGGTPK